MPRSEFPKTLIGQSLTVENVTGVHFDNEDVRKTWELFTQFLYDLESSVPVLSMPDGVIPNKTDLYILSIEAVTAACNSELLYHIKNVSTDCGDIVQACIGSTVISSIPEVPGYITNVWIILAIAFVEHYYNENRNKVHRHPKSLQNATVYRRSPNQRH